MDTMKYGAALLDNNSFSRGTGGSHDCFSRESHHKGRPRMIYSFYLGRQHYRINPRDRSTWPEALRKLFPENTRDPNLCEFGDWLCPRRGKGSHLCGGLPDKRYKFYPYWVVFNSLSDESILAPDQQLSMFEPPKRLWKYGRAYYPKRKWWVSAYHCFRGALAEAERAKKEGSKEIEIIKVTSARKREAMNLRQLDILSLGCRQQENL